MCMQDLSIVLKYRTVAFQIPDALAVPRTIGGDPALWSVTIYGGTALIFPTVRFVGIQGSVAVQLGGADSFSLPRVLDRAALGAVLDSPLVIAATAATPLTVVCQYLDQDVFQAAFDMEF